MLNKQPASLTPDGQLRPTPGQCQDGTSKSSWPLTLLPWSPFFIRILSVICLGSHGLPAVTQESWSRGSETWNEAKSLSSEVFPLRRSSLKEEQSTRIPSSSLGGLDGPGGSGTRHCERAPPVPALPSHKRTKLPPGHFAHRRELQADGHLRERERSRVTQVCQGSQAHGPSSSCYLEQAAPRSSFSCSCTGLSPSLPSLSILPGRSTWKCL